MFKKIILGVLLITVIGAAGAAIAYNFTSSESATTAAEAPLASQASAVDVQAAASESANPAAPAGEPVAQGAEGTPWQATGTVAAVDDFGFDLALEGGETVYIELGPPDYWQSQGVELTPGTAVTVDATEADGMIHATSVQVDATSEVLQIRDDSGQPLWSGGVTSGQGRAATGSADGTHTPNPQVQVDEWITLTGTLVAYQGAMMTMSTPEGDLITFQTGKPSFLASQGVTFQVGDEVSVTGFWQDDKFQAGDITQLSTGMTVFLRDPNGRPLWGGPGNGGQGGQGGHGKGGQG